MSEACVDAMEEDIKKEEESLIPTGQDIIDTPVSFSVIVPTWGDIDGLGRTLQNIIFQRPQAANISREVLVVGDGFEAGAKNAVVAANEMAKTLGQDVACWYFITREHHGNGNMPRHLGLKKAAKDWVMFIDAGTSVCYNCFYSLASAIKQVPTATLISWDMVQLLEPVPLTTTIHAVNSMSRANGLPYVLPGCAIAVKREVAQQIDWPLNARASDWAYTSQLWEKQFGVGEKEDKEKIDREVVLIPWVLTVAYGARTERKTRLPLTGEDYMKLGYDKKWTPEADENAVASEKKVEIINGV